jgi:hypothetical protein
MARVLFETDDTITEDALRDWLPPEGNKAYFSGGAAVTPNYSNNEVTVDAGVGHVIDSDGLYTFEPDQTTLALADSNGDNYIYGRFDPGTDESAEWVITSTKGSPSDPKVLKAYVDANAQTETLENEAPDQRVDLLDVRDTATDPSSNGEVTRNGSDVKVYTGGSVKNLNDIGNTSIDYEIKAITDADSPYTTSGEDVIYADTSSAAVTVTLASADVSGDRAIRVVNVDGSNAVTVDTEGSETIDPNAASSKTITKAGWGVSYTPDGSNWDASVAGEFESVTTGEADITGETYIEAHLSSDITGVSSGTFTNPLDAENDDNLDELNSSQQFSPTETGKYTILGRVQMINVTDGDLIQFRLRNVTDGDNVAFLDAVEVGGGSNYTFLQVNESTTLESSKTYEFQVRDFDSSFGVGSGSDFTKIAIVRGVVHP